MPRRAAGNSVAGMKEFSTLQWPLILGLGALALLRPLVRIVESQLGAGNTPATPIVTTLIVSAIWIAVVGFSNTAHPVLTLLLTGIAYAVFSIALSGIISPILSGELQGPLVRPFAVVPILITNAIWGLAAGGLALALQRRRGVRPGDPRAPR